MPKINPRIKSIDDLLGLDAAEESPIEPTPSVSLPTKNTIITLPPQAIRAFRGHPFRLYEGDRLNDLVESISEHGVLNPAIIRKIERDEDGFEYEMLAGHNRQNAAAIANRELPCIVKENLSDEDAWIYVIETNVLQRSFSEMLPSEKAAVLALRYSKMICQGRRNDIIEELKRLENPDEIRENPTSGTQCHRTKSRDILGAEYDLKGRAVANYLRINELITPLKRRIDDAEFPIVVAVQLSYLTEQEQKMVDDVLSGSEYKVNEGKVVLLREYTGKLTPERTEQILSGEFNRKPKKSTATAFKVKPAIYKKYFTASISQKEFDSILSAYNRTISNWGGSSGVFYGCRAVVTPDREEKRQNGRRIKNCGEPSFTITAQDRHGVLFQDCDECPYGMQIREATKKGYDIARCGDSINLSFPESKTRRGRVGKDLATTLETSCNQGTAFAGCGLIRRLTPRECWRLQGFTDEMFDKARAVNSDNQLYRQAGNSVTIQVVYAVGRQILAAQEALEQGE